MRRSTKLQRTWLGVIMLLATLPGVARTKDWAQEVGRRCPSHRVQWMPGYASADLVRNFNLTLEKQTLVEVERIADVARCEDAILGDECELSVNLEAYEKLNLTGRFAVYSCRSVKCEDVATCSKLPPSQ